MPNKSAALEMVGAVEGHGRSLLGKWTAIARRPESYGQLREFVAAIDEYSTFIDLTETKIASAKPDRLEEIMNYLTQLRVQIFGQKLDLIGQILGGLSEAALPLPLGSKPFFRNVREWIQQMRRMNNISIKEFGNGPLDPKRISEVDKLVKRAILASRDLDPIRPQGRVVTKSGAAKRPRRATPVRP